MKFEELQTLDPSLELFSPGRWTRPLLGPCPLHFPKADHFTYLKGEGYFRKHEEAMVRGDFKETGLFLEKKYFMGLNEERLNLLQRSFSFVGMTGDVGLSMALVSWPFYQQKMSLVETQVDGRQLGTVTLHPTARISQGVFLGGQVEVSEDVVIHPGVVVMGPCKIGAGTVIFPNVSLYPWTILGKRVRLHSGNVIGADGFGYHFHQGVHHKIWHIGGVEIGDDVEIGANSTVDGGTFAPTCIGKGSKIDNQVQIGHNSQVEQGVILCGQVGLAGSTRVGQFSVFGGKSGLAPDLEVGAFTQVAGSAMINKSWPAKSQLGGHPARPLKEWLRSLAFVSRESQKKRE